MEEYWILDVHSRSIEIYFLVDSAYKLINNYMLVDDPADPDYNANVEISMNSFPKVQLKLSDIFLDV